MFKKTVRTTVAALAVTLLLSSCGGGLPDYDYRVDMDKYKEYITVSDEYYLILVNKQNPCGSSYAPRKLSALSGSLSLYGKSVDLDSTAAMAVEALILEMRAAGYEDIAVTSGYRDYAYQQILFNTYLGNEQAAHPNWTTAQCEAEVQTYSARPGESEHQTGLCVDLISTKNPALNESFADHPAYGWLVENAHCFGFQCHFYRHIIAPRYGVENEYVPRFDMVFL